MVKGRRDPRRGRCSTCSGRGSCGRGGDDGHPLPQRPDQRSGSASGRGRPHLSVREGTCSASSGRTGRESRRMKHDRASCRRRGARCCGAVSPTARPPPPMRVRRGSPSSIRNLTLHQPFGGREPLHRRLPPQARPDRLAGGRDADARDPRAAVADGDPWTEVGTLSPGERQLVEIAKALHTRRGS